MVLSIDSFQRTFDMWQFVDISKLNFSLFFFVDFALTNQMSHPYFGITLETHRSFF